MLREFVIAGLGKASRVAKKGEAYFEGKVTQDQEPTPIASGSSQGRTVTPAAKTPSTATKVDSASKTYPPKAPDYTPSITQTRTADPLPRYKSPGSSAVSKLTSQFESNSSAPSRPSPSSPPAPNITPSAKKETSYTPQVTQSTPPSGARTFGAPPTPRPTAPIETSTPVTPLPKKITTVHPQVLASNAPSGGSGRSLRKPLPRPTAPNETNAPVVAPNTSLYSFGTKPLPRPTAPIETNAPHSSPVPKKISPLYSFGAKPLSPPSAPQSQSSTMTPPQPSQFGVKLRSPVTPAPSYASPQIPPAPLSMVSGSSSVAAIKTIEAEPVKNPAEFIWIKIRAKRERIASLDIQPECDASGNIIASAFDYGDQACFKFTLKWKLCYADEAGVNREVQFTSYVGRTHLMPKETASADAKAVLWKAYLSMLANINAAQKSLNPAHQGTDLWNRPLDLVQSAGIGCKNGNTVPVNSKNFDVQISFSKDGCNDFSFPVRLSTLPQFTIDTSRPAIVPCVSPDLLMSTNVKKSKLVETPMSLSAAELAQLKGHALYPLNSLAILEAKYTPTGQRNYLAEVEAILDYLKPFARGQEENWSDEQKKNKHWGKFIFSVKVLEDSVRKWKASGQPLPLREHGYLDLNFGYIQQIKYFPDEQRTLLGSHLSIKQSELSYILLKNAEGANLPNHVRKWAKKGGGSEISALVMSVRDGQMDGSIDNQAMALLQRQIPELKSYMEMFNNSLDSTVSQHYNNDLQKYHPALFKQEMKAYKASQAYTPSKTVYRSEMMGSNDPRYGSAVRTATRQQHVAETISSGYSGGSLSMTTPSDLRHYGWVLADDGSRQYPKGNSASGDCAVM